MIEHYSSQLQWKQKEQIWSDRQTKNVKCKFECEATLVQDWLVQRETYEARVRVMSQTPYEGTWSDWSPTVTWVPLVGRTRLGSGNDVGVLNWSILGMALFGLLLLPGVCFTVLKSTCSRVYFEKIIGSPLPNPAKSAQFNTWLNPYFSSESYHSFLKSVDIVPVEIFSVVDDIILYNPEVKKMPDNNTYESSCSSFSNPGYSHFCSASPGFPFSPGSLGRSAVDASYMNVSVQEEEKNKKQDCDVTKKKQEMVKLLLMGRVNSEALGISDYKNVYKLQAEPQRLHSTDSGMSSYEENSQWIMEGDSIHVIEGDDERDQCIPEDNEGNEAKSDVQKLFEGSVGFLDKSSVISPYKVIPIINAKNKDLHRLYSVDSGMSSFEEVSQDSIEENSILEMEEHDEGALSGEREKEEVQKLFEGHKSPQFVSH
ncbi:PREDICTED: uncharacterized protein LOC107084271 [Cyprinodon variegatus]|uniref:uncharacterized protein LOC107084271 n=1 Tax=Cyprinodon variegatus TaxID=28743 RepID=UPI0007425D72|nr:PREDICTED: uncharacterized protein LOC107084271 [Cyprinodon variegatus]